GSSNWRGRASLRLWLLPEKRLFLAARYYTHCGPHDGPSAGGIRRDCAAVHIRKRCSVTTRVLQGFQMVPQSSSSTTGFLP
ncbi:hypothetical protein FOZ62_004658, partial [Perkinsus olseni]